MKKLLTLSLFSILLLGACKGEPVDGQYAEVAQCLTDKGVKMYGAFWCPHCAEQKERFGDDFRYITYIECDDRDPAGDSEACRAAGVQNYPTWTFPGQEKEVGTQDPLALANKANCDIPESMMPTTDNEPAMEESEDVVEEGTEADENEAMEEEPTEETTEE